MLDESYEKLLSCLYGRLKILKGMRDIRKPPTDREVEELFLNKYKLLVEQLSEANDALSQYIKNSSK